jgi:predicted dehydrogenase
VINAAVIGISGFGQMHYEDLMAEQQRGALRIVGATVINQDEEQEKCRKLQQVGCTLYGDYREMFAALAGKIDLCCIATGIHLHAPMTLAALGAGANVFVEKPAAATVDEVDAMRDAARAAGRFVAVGYQTMYAAETPIMKQAILQGEVGAVRSIRSRALWPRTRAYYTRNGWAGRLRLGENWVLDSPFNNAVAHQLNMICFLAGKRLETTAELTALSAELYRANDIESTDTACLRMETASGIELFYVVTHCSDGCLNPEIIVDGDRGSIRWSWERTYILRDGRLETIDNERATIRRTIMRRLRERISDPGVFICDLEVARAQTLCANGAHDCSAITTIAAPYVRREPFEDSQRSVVDGIDDVVNRAFTERRLFSELGVPWARPTRRIELGGYSHFAGLYSELTT